MEWRKDKMNDKNLTEKQKKNLKEFLEVTLTCDEEQLAAMDHQIPMTRELFEQCLDTLIQIHAVRQIENLLQEFPELAKECGKDFDEVAEMFV